MTFREYVRHLLRPTKIYNYSNSPKYYSSSRWLEGGQNCREEIREVRMESGKSSLIPECSKCDVDEENSCIKEDA